MNLHFWRFREISLRAEGEIVRQAKTGHENGPRQHELRQDYVRKGLAVEYVPEPTAAQVSHAIAEVEAGNRK